MPLAEYRRKRRFAKTPEPKGAVRRARRRALSFVVQKHAASHLHYDFRLELDGVLKSWAVPKGPSLDPADKRLAMQVEDHPVSYFDFEGIIPAGNYGAGTVMVWDVGTWQPLGDAHEMLRKGDLKFRLEGKKLKGEFALVHMKSRRPGSKGTEWLLIKHRDGYVQPDYDIEQYDKSVLTKRSMSEIAGDKGSAEWESSRKAAARGGSSKNDWLADTIAKVDARKAKQSGNGTKAATKRASTAKEQRASAKRTPAKAAASSRGTAVKKNSSRKKAA